MDEYESPMPEHINNNSEQEPHEAAVVEEDTSLESLDIDVERVKEIEARMLTAAQVASRICEKANLRGPNDIQVIMLRIYDELKADDINENLRSHNTQAEAFQ